MDRIWTFKDNLLRKYRLNNYLGLMNLRGWAGIKGSNTIILRSTCMILCKISSQIWKEVRCQCIILCRKRRLFNKWPWTDRDCLRIPILINQILRLSTKKLVDYGNHSISTMGYQPYPLNMRHGPLMWSETNTLDLANK